MLQGKYLAKRLEILKTNPDEIYERIIEVFEMLFTEKKAYAHAYICCFMILLKQRNSLGLPNIELHYIKRALRLHKRVSKREFRADFANFTPIFRTILSEAGKVSLCCFIFVKMQLYLSYFHKYNGNPSLAIAQAIVYVNYRLEYGMYSRTEEIIADLLNFTIECIQHNFLQQAIHLLNGVRALLDRLSSIEPEVRFQKVVLLEFTLAITSLLLSKNINNVRGYQNQEAFNRVERESFIPKSDVTVLKLIVPDAIKLKLAANDCEESEVIRLKSKLLLYQKLLKEPIILDLNKIFQRIMDFLLLTESFDGIVPRDCEWSLTRYSERIHFDYFLIFLKKYFLYYCWIFQEFSKNCLHNYANTTNCFYFLYLKKEQKIKVLIHETKNI